VYWSPNLCIGVLICVLES